MLSYLLSMRVLAIFTIFIVGITLVFCGTITVNYEGKAFFDGNQAENVTIS